MAGQRQLVTQALREWLDAGRPCVLATVVSSTDSAPRGIGAQLAISTGDTWTGGLSGGCAEIAVLTEARELIAGSDETSAVRIFMTKDEFGGVGPVCGATLGVLIERVDTHLLAQLEAVVRSGAEGQGSSVHATYAIAERRDDRLVLQRSEFAAATEPDDSRALRWEEAAEQATLEQHIRSPRHLVVCGAGDIGAELLLMANQLGWRTTLIDPRSAFLEQTLGAAHADNVLRSWPGDAFAAAGVRSDTACVAAAHDERLDMPFLELACTSDAFYTGSVGSRVVQAARADELSERVGPEAAARHRGPAGLNLGGGQAAEIALSIMAEILAVANDRAGAPLINSTEPIRASSRN